MTRPSRRHARALLAVVVMTLLAGWAIDAAAGSLLNVDASDAIRVLRDSGPAAPLVLMALMVVAVVVPPVPSVPLDVAAGVVFGAVWGVVWVLIGAEIGAIIAFLIARRLGRDWVRGRVDPATLARVDDAIEHQGARALVVLRLLPTFHFDWVSYAAGLSTLRLAPFALSTLIGMTPPVIAIVLVGDQLTSRPALALSIFGALVVAGLAPLVWWSIAPDRSESPDV